MQPAIKLRKGKKLVGTVVSAKMQKTVVVEVRRLVRHRRYGKYLVRSKRYLAHDEGQKSKVGDQVTIQESRPLSRHKHFKIIEAKTLEARS